MRTHLYLIYKYKWITQSYICNTPIVPPITITNTHNMLFLLRSRISKASGQVVSISFEAVQRLGFRTWPRARISKDSDVGGAIVVGFREPPKNWYPLLLDFEIQKERCFPSVWISHVKHIRCFNFVNRNSRHFEFRNQSMGGRLVSDFGIQNQGMQPCVWISKSTRKGIQLFRRLSASRPWWRHLAGGYRNAWPK